MKTFNIAILPGAPRVDIQRFDLVVFEPLLNRVCNKLRAVIAAYMLRNSVGGHSLQ
jgi:hypothetical protein